MRLPRNRLNRGPKRSESGHAPSSRASLPRRLRPSGHRWHLRRAVRASPRLFGDVAQALRAPTRGLRGRLGGLHPRHRAVHRQDHDEVDDRGRDQEGQDVVDEVAPQDGPGADRREVGGPPTRAIRGVMRLVTTESTTAPKATPITTATASSTTFPRRMKSLNPLSTVAPPSSKPNLLPTPLPALDRAKDGAFFAASMMPIYPEPVSISTYIGAVRGWIGATRTSENLPQAKFEGRTSTRLLDIALYARRIP
jgi:hypothetical protein